MNLASPPITFSNVYSRKKKKKKKKNKNNNKDFNMNIFKKLRN